MKTVTEGQVEFQCKPHQLYNSLVTGIPNNRSLAISSQMFGTMEESAGFTQQADYQESLLLSLFGVKYVDV